jgi:Kef-type K+ transport system membrane component KefB/mannitol/fructose-specific phosphotransferase system IIA component (Ntr-type)
MGHHDVTLFLLSLAVIVGGARLFGELARRLGQASLVGEILVGVLLGPTVFGMLAPEMQSLLFPMTGPRAVAMESLSAVAVIMFLLVAGLEVDLSAVWRIGRASLVITAVKFGAAFATGYLFARLAPELTGRIASPHPEAFDLFLATAFAITALPVIAKILMELNMFRSDFGMTIISSAIVADLAAAVLFAAALGMGGVAKTPFSAQGTILLTLVFAAGILTLGRLALHRLLPWLQAHASWPGGVLGFAMTGAFACAAFTEWIGVHAIIGSFLFGVALGDSRHLTERTRSTIDQFVSSIFAPLFFVGIGLKADFAEAFDPLLVGVMVLMATGSKVLACYPVSRWGGLTARESIALGFALNAGGAILIVLSMVAHRAGMIPDRMFVALVTLAVVSSITVGPILKAVLRRPNPVRLAALLSPRLFLGALKATDRRGAIEELGRAAAAETRLDPEYVIDSVWHRELTMPTGLGHGLAVPHARVQGLAAPVVAVGRAPDGIDFDAPDGEPARLVFLILTPVNADSAQLELLADIAKTFREPKFLRAVLGAKGYTEFRAQLNIREG